MRLHNGGNVSTPGASAQQASQVYNGFAAGNLKAIMGGNLQNLGANLWDMVGGDFAGVNGVFNAQKGINHNMILII